ncbi:hypothetical protein, partial [Streptococcus pneumoniae]|uniref:hypothetical protein n=1 Tax=Streptococcus pneumoniae TaxID=1313 RepID=UPI001E5B4DCB
MMLLGHKGPCGWEKAEQELHAIDELLARRPALDEPTRYANIAKAIYTAGRASDRALQAEAEVARLRAEHERLTKAVLALEWGADLSIW